MLKKLMKQGGPIAEKGHANSHKHRIHVLLQSQKAASHRGADTLLMPLRQILQAPYLCCQRQSPAR